MVNSILIVGADKGIQIYIKELLLNTGYSVQTVTDGIAALKYIQINQPDLVVLDLTVPNLSGESIGMEIKKRYPELPVVILTAKNTAKDKDRGANLGTDDTIPKPFEDKELLARIKAKIGRKDKTLKVANLELDTERIELKRSKKLIKLTPQEYKLLHYLMSNKGRILTRNMILNRIWSSAGKIETRVVDVYIGYLRKKIDSGFKKKLLHSVRGFGYTIKE